MKTFRVLTLFAAISFSSPFQLRAEEFRSIFDGESLKGWKALNMSYWSIEDGAITAVSTEQNPCTSNQFMVWQGGDVADFELKLKFRVSGNGCNSGVQFRSRIKPNGLAVGYQADIYESGGYLGGVCDELQSRKGRRIRSTRAGNGWSELVTLWKPAGFMILTPAGTRRRPSCSRMRAASSPAIRPRIAMRRSYSMITTS